MLGQNWEPGVTCPGCGREIGVGAQVLYGRHLDCARSRSNGGPADPVQAAQAALDAGGRVAIAKPALRALALLACERLGAEPVRRPDRGRHGVRWYARISGWSVARVEAGLTVPEVSGLFLDALDHGRTPPVSHAHLKALLGAASATVSKEPALGVAGLCGDRRGAARQPGHCSGGSLGELGSARPGAAVKAGHVAAWRGGSRQSWIGIVRMGEQGTAWREGSPAWRRWSPISGTRPAGSSG